MSEADLNAGKVTFALTTNSEQSRCCAYPGRPKQPSLCMLMIMFPPMAQVAARGVHIQHRYSQPVECDVVVTLGGTETNRILIYNIRRK